LGAHSVELCAGWLTSPEARMACCRQGACPMDASKVSSDPSRAVTQKEADNCCASSESAQAEQGTPANAAILPPLELAPGLFSSAASATLSFDAWRDAVPLVTNDPRIHLLLSVFLI